MTEGERAQIARMDLKRTIKDGQDMAALSFRFVWSALAYNDIEAALYWQERQRKHSARCRSMLFNDQENCHG